MYDVIVIGARCAGSPTAMLLARKGYRVLLVDKGTFPSDTVSTHFIQLTGVERLRRWGLLERVAASNCPPLALVIDIGPIALRGTPSPAGDIALSYAPRRKVLDTLLAEAAIEAGVELREGFAVDEIMADGPRVTGIYGHAKGGARITETARIVIGADGARSLVARSVRAAEYQTVPARTCYHYSYWAGLCHEGAAELYLRGGRAIFMAPTNDGLCNIGVAWPQSEFRTFQADIAGNFLKTLEAAPALAERVRHAQRVERFVGYSGRDSFFRTPYGPGWALAGDAGYHKDPITGQGIGDAFRDAELLAEAVDSGFSGRQPLAEALAAYERRRNEAAGPIYEVTDQYARLEPPSAETQQLFAALRRNPGETSRFYGTIAGTVPIAEFFAPENIGRIVTA